AADLYARLRPRHGIDSETEFRAIADAPLLMVDDLGAAKTSEWVEEVNYRLINWRYDRVLPTVFTSNVLPKELKVALGERVASRLVEMADRVTLKGEDRRRTPCTPTPAPPRSSPAASRLTSERPGRSPPTPPAITAPASPAWPSPSWATSSTPDGPSPTSSPSPTTSTGPVGPSPDRPARPTST